MEIKFLNIEEVLVKIFKMIFIIKYYVPINVKKTVFNITKIYKNDVLTS